MTPTTSRIEFIDGPLDGHRFQPDSIEGAWKLVLIVASVGERFLFEILNETDEPEALGACRDSTIALFTSDHTGQYIAVIQMDGQGPIDGEIIKLLDGRWPLAYFVPQDAFIPLSSAAELFRRVLAGLPTKKQLVDQTFRNPAVVDLCPDEGP